MGSFEGRFVTCVPVRQLGKEQEWCFKGDAASKRTKIGSANRIDFASTGVSSEKLLKRANWIC